MANPASWLAKAGKFVLSLVTGATKLAKAFEPEVDIAVPEVAALYNETVAFASVAEAALGDGTGPIKLDALTAAVIKYADDNGWVGVEADVKKWAGAVADTLNQFPFTKKPA